MDCNPPGSSVHGDSPGKNTRVGCQALLQWNFLDLFKIFIIKFFFKVSKGKYIYVNAIKVHLGYGFSSGHVWMWELDCEESWATKNRCFWTVVLEKTLESPLGCKEIQPVHPEGDLSWVFIGRADAEAETPVLWPPHAKSWLIGKDPDAGRDWGQEEKGMTEDEMVGWHHLLDGTWVWVNSGSWWWTGRRGVLRFMGLQRVGHDRATELN